MKYLLILLSIIVLPAFAQTPLKVKSIYIYKDGNAFVTASANGSTSNKIMAVSSKQISNIVFGTLAVNGPSKLTMIKNAFDSVIVSRQVVNTLEMLKANESKTVHFQFENEKIEGLIKTVILDKSANPNGFAIIQSGDKNIVISGENISQIKNIWFGDEVKLDINQKRYYTTYNFQFEKDFANQNVDFSYLTYHGGWGPSYSLFVDKDKYNLELNTEFGSGNFEFSNAQVYLVDGYANFNGTGVSGLMESSGNYNKSYEDMYATEMQVEAAEGSGYGYHNHNYGSEYGTNKRFEDYQIYDLGKISIPAYTTMQVNLLKATGSVEHFYKCVIGFREEYGYYNSAGGMDREVSSVLEVKNTGEQPWLPAPVLVKRSLAATDIPMGQVIMPLIKPGASGEIVMGASATVSVKHHEEQEKGSPDNYGGTEEVQTEDESDDSGTIVANFEIKNSQLKTITLKIERQITGTLVSSEIKPTQEYGIPLEYDMSIKTTKLVWEIKLKAGETKKFNYKYIYKVNKAY